MNRNYVLVVVMAVVLTACRSHYEVASVERSRILVDARYDHFQNADAVDFISPYQHVVDSVMGPVVGRSAKYMSPHRPESELSNLLADIMVWGAGIYHEHPDFGVYNMGGVRADLPEGDVTYGDVLDIAPFENKIAFVTLTGEEVLELFSQFASTGGEGVSHGVKLVITQDGKLVSASLKGEPIDPKRNYRIATIDYLLGGNDKMLAFQKGKQVNSPQEFENNTRFIIMDYFREQTRQGKMVDAEMEGRIVIKQ
ncbi:MAG: 5'-nucleotidase C-terminal domain-containing protein [Prevotella sp.]|nr:5'-nucleotidase C-terminal domain-containing protein [Prevotella sp.]